MGLTNLAIHSRSTKGKNENRRARAAGRIPAVIYGKERDTEVIELDSAEFTKAMKTIGSGAALFSLEQEGGDDDAIALLREVQTNPCTDEILHVDLMAIPRGVPVTVAVALQFVGVPVAVRAGEGSVATSLDSVEISVRPRDVPDFIEVDISELELNDKIFIKDLKVEVGEVISDPEALVLNVRASTLTIEEEVDEEGVEGEEGEEGEGESTEDDGETKED